MSLYKIIHFFFGEYVFEVEQADFARLANLLSNEKILFWGNEHVGGRVKFGTNVFFAEKVASIAGKSHIKARITERKGLPFLFSRYRRRYGLFFGMAVALFLLFFSQLFIWKIEINGNSSVPSSKIESALSDLGLAVGVYNQGLNITAKENQLLLNLREISSVAITINGTYMSVTVLERTPLPEIVDTGGYYNVVAARDGTVLDIDAAEGYPEVSEGEVVYKGELLINSFIELENGTFRPTHARGNVFAAVNEKIEINVPYNRISKQYTGRTKIKNKYKIIGWDVPSFSFNSDYEYFDYIYAESDIKLFGFIALPIKRYRITYIEYLPKEELITPDQAEQIARSELNNRLKSLGCELLGCETRVENDEKNGTCRLVADAVLKQNIALEVEFDLNHSMSARLPIAVE